MSEPHVTENSNKDGQGPEETEIQSKEPVESQPTPQPTESQGEQAASGVGPMGKQTSIVWSHFKQTEKGAKKAWCPDCNGKLVAGSKNGTTHLREHMEKCHKKKEVGTLGSPCYLGSIQVVVYNFNQDTSRKDLAEMVILHEYPLSIVDHFGFRKFCGGLQPLFKVISRNTLKSDILKIYKAEREKLMTLLHKNRGRIAVTSDMWTANHQNKSYMVITIHFIDNAWNLHQRILRFVYVHVPHTSEVLSKVLEETLFQWNIDRKISTKTLDNCTTNDAVINFLLSNLQNCSLILRGRLLHMRCAAHILNLVVQDGLSIILKEIHNVRESVRFWTASPKRAQRFEEAVFREGIPYTKKLVLDCKTRWNSTFLMLSTALLYKDVFHRLKREKLYVHLPSDDDWFLAQEICDHLQIFYNSTELFSKTKSPTVNVFFPVICDIRIELKKWIHGNNECVKKMPEKMIEKFDKYWDVVHGIMSVALLLDLRHKSSLLEFTYPLMFGDRASAKINEVKQICVEMYDEYKYKNERPDRRNSSGSNLESDVLGKRKNCGNLVGYDSFLANKEITLQEKSELDRYLEDGHVPLDDSNFDILSWWKTGGSKYPILQMIARDIFSIPVSTVASESAFSTSGRVVNPHRSRLRPSTLEALMCCQSWLSNEKKDLSDDDDDDEAASGITSIEVD